MKQQILRKGVSMTIILILLTTILGHGIGAIRTGYNTTNIKSLDSKENSIELIDQSNGASGCGGCSDGSSLLLKEEISVAQSFIPSHSILSKVSIFFSKSGTPSEDIKFILRIKESLYDDELAYIEVDAYHGYVDFDFQDITVTPGTTYYMIFTTDGVSTQINGFSWPYTKEDHYTNGAAYMSQGPGSWHEIEEGDMVFMTFWRDYSPEIPEVTGPNDGNAQERYDYMFSTTDPEGDDIYFYIEWGDGKSTRWKGPYESGEQITWSHQWAVEGEYSILVKARDVYGVETDWNEFQLTLPKNKPVFSSFRMFLENHPHLFPILRLLLT